MIALTHCTIKRTDISFCPTEPESIFIAANQLTVVVNVKQPGRQNRQIIQAYYLLSWLLVVPLTALRIWKAFRQGDGWILVRY